MLTAPRLSLRDLGGVLERWRRRGRAPFFTFSRTQIHVGHGVLDVQSVTSTANGAVHSTKKRHGQVTLLLSSHRQRHLGRLALRGQSRGPEVSTLLHDRVLPEA